MKKIIITGATGFIGSHLCKKMVDLDYEVSIIVRPKSNYRKIKNIFKKINIFIYENNDIKGLIKFFKKINPDIVFHLASLYISEHQPKDIFDLINSNINFGTHILEAMARNNIRKIINTGTSWQHYKNEKYNPVCLYAATKEAFEKILEYYVKALEFEAITLKLFDTYGEDDDRGKLISLLKKFSQEKRTLEMSPGEQEIDLLHVDDVVEAFLSASFLFDDKDIFITHNKYAVNSGRKVKLKELIDIYEKNTGYKLRIKWGSRSYRKREVINLWDKYNSLPNWKPKITLEEGLKRLNSIKVK
jgi:nucleoside-diphosphate-sugar epimerase